MSQEAMEAVLANSKSQRGLRAVLLALAWRTYDRAPPFTGPFTVRSIAKLANVQHRQAQTDIAMLRKMGELVVTGKQGREYVFGVNVPLANYAVPDVDNYAVPDVVQEGDDTNYAVPDVDNYAVSDVDNYAVSDVVTTQYPAYRSYKETRNKSEQEVTFPPPHVDNAQDREEAEQRETPSPLPPSPVPILSASETWKLILTYLEGEVSKHELDSWHSRCRVAWSDTGVFVIRGGASLMQFKRFQSCVTYALAGLGSDAQIDFQVREERRA